MNTIAERGFPRAELEARTALLQERMAARQLDSVVLTTEPNVRYFSGFFTQFWQSPTRPWFLVIPADGKPIAVIPEIGASAMAATWIDDIRTWPSPRPADDGVSLLAEAVLEVSRRHRTIGMTLGAESFLRMPVASFTAFQERIQPLAIHDIAAEIQQQRMVKSRREIAKIKTICDLVSAGFQALPGFAAVGMSEQEIVRRFKIDLLQRGADAVPYMVAGSGPGGYASIIMGPTERELRAGDLLMIDTGSMFDGYFCDFDRNWGFGAMDDASRRAHEVVWDATEAGFAAARPGATTTDLWQAMHRVMVAGGSLGNEVGRLGHGLGMELTERPSNVAGDDTVLRPGMVLTLEPGMTFARGRQMVHEENIVITEDGAQWLTRRAPRELVIIHEGA